MTPAITKSEAPVGEASAVSIDAALCTGCGACIEACPTDVLRLGDLGKAVVAYPRDCHVCFLCVDDCPTHAVAVDHGVKNPRRVSVYAELSPETLKFVL